MANAFPGFSANNCTPLYFQVDPSAGCSLSQSDIVPLTKNKISELSLTEFGLAAIIAGTKEARMAGVPQNRLHDLLLSRRVKGEGVPASGFAVPWVMRPRRNVVNALYFHVTATGAVPGGFTAGTTHATYGYIPAGAFSITVSNGHTGTGNNYNSNLNQIQNYFLPGSFVMIETTVRYTGAAYQTAHTGGGGTLDDYVRVQLRVHAALNASATTATLVVSPPVGNTSSAATDVSWTPLTAAQKAFYNVAQGTLLRLANNVMDREQWCHQTPAVQNTDLVEYWLQTRRWVHKWNDEYKRILDYLESGKGKNEIWKKFRSLPLAVQRAQRERLAQDEFANTCFWGQPADITNQTQANYANLERVYDPYNPTCPFEYKTTTKGWETQLAECNRVIDRQAGVLNMDVFAEQLYALQRERSNVGETETYIDGMAGRKTCSRIHDFFLSYYKAKYGSAEIRFPMEIGKSVMATIGSEERAVLKYNRYWLPDQNVALDLYHMPFFDDKIGGSRAIGSGTPNTFYSNALWLYDWSDLQINVHKVNSKKRVGHSEVEDKLFNCTMEDDQLNVLMMSERFDCQVGNPNRHLIFKNFSDACPTGTASTCPVS